MCVASAALALALVATGVHPSNVGAQGPLRSVFARMTSVKRPHEEQRLRQALGWNMFRLGPNEILAHTGSTFGFQSRLIVDTTRKRAVVAWINGAGAGVSDFVGLALDRLRLQ
jgi:hypothetical protein